MPTRGELRPGAPRDAGQSNRSTETRVTAMTATTPTSNIELMQGTLDLLVLRTLTWGQMHGYAVARQIRERSRDVILVEEGALYPALHRLERRGWIQAEWGLSENNRRAKFYELTAAGREQLRRELATWTRYTEAVARVLSPA
jgi:PadR family transcriptional regulator